MKRLPLVLCLIAALGLAAFLVVSRNPGANPPPAKPAAAGESVQLKPGRGLGFHPRLHANLNLQTAEVVEQSIAAAVRLNLMVTVGAANADSPRRITQSSTAAATAAAGWLTAADAARLVPGQEVELRSTTTVGAIPRGRILRLEKSAYAVLGDFEVVVETSAAFEAGTKLEGLCRLPAGEAVPAIPRSALLQTAEGSFVYAVNDGFYLRTPVKIGAASEEFVELTEGLYAGDQIVTSPVQALWMAELQLLRGGKACTCGH